MKNKWYGKITILYCLLVINVRNGRILHEISVPDKTDLKCIRTSIMPAGQRFLHKFHTRAFLWLFFGIFPINWVQIIWPADNSTMFNCATGNFFSFIRAKVITMINGNAKVEKRLVCWCIIFYSMCTHEGHKPKRIREIIIPK